MSIADLLTPCLLLDRPVMRRNIDRMRRHIATGGSTLRPHLKTAKCVEIAREITGDHSGGLTVSSLAEIRHFAEHGFRDFLYSVAPPPGKLSFITDLMRRDLTITVLADNAASVQAIIAHGRRTGLPLSVLLEVDCDGHRSGLAPESSEITALARLLASSGSAVFRGIMTHAGGAYECRSVSAIQTAAAGERTALLSTAARLAGAGLPCEILSAGSTPTAALGETFAGLTEIRAGVFVFNDLTMVNLGVCAIADVALSVLTTVIGHRPAAGQLVTDAGWMALSADLSTQGLAADYRYGLVCDGRTGRPLDGLIVVGANQEHGLIGRSNGNPIDMARHPVGQMLRILPVHACATAAAHGSYQVIDGTDEPVAEWQRVSGW